VWCVGLSFTHLHMPAGTNAGDTFMHLECHQHETRLSPQLHQNPVLELFPNWTCSPASYPNSNPHPCMNLDANSCGLVFTHLSTLGMRSNTKQSTIWSHNLTMMHNLSPWWLVWISISFSRWARTHVDEIQYLHTLADQSVSWERQTCPFAMNQQVDSQLDPSRVEIDLNSQRS
jgi:hypothetical protein